MNGITFYDVVFTTEGKQYSYLSGGVNYAVGEYVVVPVGRNGRETIAKIEAVRNCGLQLPAEQLKTIIRRANEAESEAFNKGIKSSVKKTQKFGKTRKGDHTESRKEESQVLYDGIQEDGSLIFSYEDYGVECFDGMDYEVTYKLDSKNAEKLREYLGQRHTGSIMYMLEQECGHNFRKKGASELLEEAGVEYEHFVWIS